MKTHYLQAQVDAKLCIELLPDALSGRDMCSLPVALNHFLCPQHAAIYDEQEVEWKRHCETGSPKPDGYSHISKVVYSDGRVAVVDLPCCQSPPTQIGGTQ